MTTKIFLAGFLLLVIAGHLVAQELIDIKDSIDRIKKCYSSDMTQFNKCLFEFWIEVKPLLPAGIPDLKVPRLDPLIIEKMEIAETGAVVQGRATFDNLTVTGLGQYVPKSVIADIAKQTITVEIYVPLMVVDGIYDVDGVALLLPVKGNGKFLMKLFGVDGKAVAFIEREGANGVRLAKTDIDFNIRNISTHMENLLGGEEVGAALNNLINDNAQEILNDVKPAISVKLGEGITKILAGAIKELPAEAFILPEGFVPPEGFVLSEGITIPTSKSDSSA